MEVGEAKLQSVGGDMRRLATLRVGALSALMLGAVTLSASTSASASVPGPGLALQEWHAPRIPGPTPTTRPGALAVIREWSSKNWSGYAVTGTAFTQVTGTWRVPQVQVPRKRHYRKNTFSSSWVGIDGFGNGSLIQAGTEQDWVNGKPFYQAWWEVLPAPETPISPMPIRPGDEMTVSITGGLPDWTITVTDVTTSQSSTTLHRYSGPETSAEWIQEAPTIGRHVATLAADATVTFDGGTLNGANPGLIDTDAGAMYKGRHTISSPSVPDSDRDGFAVAYGALAPSAPPS